MEKFYLKSNNEEVKIGSTIFHLVKKKVPFGIAVHQEELTLDEKLLNKLLEEGVIYKKETKDAAPKEKEEAIVDLSKYIESIAKKQGWHLDKAVNILNLVYTLNPMSALNIILREIAIDLDKKYEDHIQNSPKIFIISTLNGKIGEVNKAHIANYRNFAAFRTIEDAKAACKIVSPILRGIFKNGRKK